MDKLSITKNLIIIFFFIFAFTIIHSFSFAEPIIMINSQSSKPGEKVTFTVSISPGTEDSTEIENFGFIIQYNDEILEYINYSADSIKDHAIFGPLINKLSNGSLQAGGSFMPPVKIDKTINLFQIDFECLDCTESKTSLKILKKDDDLKNFTSLHGTFNCLGTEEKEEESVQQTDQKKIDTTIQEDTNKIIELTNKTPSKNQQEPGLDSFYPTIHSDKTASNQSTGGGTAGGQPQEPSDISNLSIPFRSIPSVQNTFPRDGAKDIQTNTTVRITFNQSMSQIMLEDAFVIEPYLDGQFKWNKDFTEVNFIPDSQLEPGAMYSIHLTDQAADKYGQCIDGNFDGKMGGKFSFSFQTTDNGKDISEEKPDTISPNVTRCFIMSI